MRKPNSIGARPQFHAVPADRLCEAAEDDRLVTPVSFTLIVGGYLIGETLFVSLRGFEYLRVLIASDEPVDGSALCLESHRAPRLTLAS